MEINEKTQDLVTNIGAAALGVLAWEREATLKYKYVGYSLFSSGRMADAIAGVAGHDIAQKIVPSWTGGAQFHPNPMGWANKTVMYAAIANIVNGLAKNNVKQYRDIPILADFVHKATIAVAIGAAFGGIFDPDPDHDLPNSNGNGKTLNMTNTASKGMPVYAYTQGGN